MENVFLVLLLLSILGLLLCIIAPRLVKWLIPGKPTRLKGIPIFVTLFLFFFFSLGLELESANEASKQSTIAKRPPSYRDDVPSSMSNNTINQIKEIESNLDDSLIESLNSKFKAQTTFRLKKADSMFGEYSFGRSLEERKEYYSRMINLERKARNFADSVIPDYMTFSTENWDLFVSKKEEWVRELRKLYGFSQAQAESISYEAYLRNWPLPEVSPEIKPPPAIVR